MALEQGSKEVKSGVNKKCFNHDVENSEQILRQSISTRPYNFNIRVRKMIDLIQEPLYKVFEYLFLDKNHENIEKHEQEKVENELKLPKQNSPPKPTIIVSGEKKTEQLVSETPLIAVPKLLVSKPQTHTMNPIPEYLPVKEQNAVMNRTKVVETAAFEHIFIRPSNYVRLQNKSLKRETSKIPIPTTGGIKKKPNLNVYTNTYIKNVVGKFFYKNPKVVLESFHKDHDDIIDYKKPNLNVYTNTYIKNLMGKLFYKDPIVLSQNSYKLYEDLSGITDYIKNFKTMNFAPRFNHDPFPKNIKEEKGMGLSKKCLKSSSSITEKSRENLPKSSAPCTITSQSILREFKIEGSAPTINLEYFQKKIKPHDEKKKGSSKKFLESSKSVAVVSRNEWPKSSAKSTLTSQNILRDIKVEDFSKSVNHELFPKRVKLYKEEKKHSSKKSFEFSNSVSESSRNKLPKSSAPCTITSQTPLRNIKVEDFATIHDHKPFPKRVNPQKEKKNVSMKNIFEFSNSVAEILRNECPKSSAPCTITSPTPLRNIKVEDFPTSHDHKPFPKRVKLQKERKKGSLKKKKSFESSNSVAKSLRNECRKSSARCTIISQSMLREFKMEESLSSIDHKPSQKPINPLTETRTIHSRNKQPKGSAPCTMTSENASIEMLSKLLENLTLKAAECHKSTTAYSDSIHGVDVTSPVRAPSVHVARKDVRIKEPSVCSVVSFPHYS